MFDVTNSNAEFDITALYLTFAATQTVGHLDSNELGSLTARNNDAVSGLKQIRHQNQVTDKLFSCDPTETNENLNIPPMKSATIQGSATHYDYMYGVTAISNTLSNSASNVFMNDYIQTGNSEAMAMQGATIIDQVSGKKKVFIKNQNPADKYQQ